jgi:phosphopantetheine adenylyltransferase
VIVVVGMNPAKKYLVSPEQRADLLRRMLRDHKAASTTRVQGTLAQGQLYTFLEVTSRLLNSYLLYHFRLQSSVA